MAGCASAGSRGDGGAGGASAAGAAAAERACAGGTTCSGSRPSQRAVLQSQYPVIAVTSTSDSGVRVLPTRAGRNSSKCSSRRHAPDASHLVHRQRRSGPCLGGKPCPEVVERAQGASSSCGKQPKGGACRPDEERAGDRYQHVAGRSAQGDEPDDSRTEWRRTAGSAAQASPDTDGYSGEHREATCGTPATSSPRACP